LRGRNACELHGGKSPRGAAHPSFKHGRQSKYAAFVPAQLREAHQRFLADPEARELREEKAIAALVLCEQLRRIGDGADQAAAGGALLSAQKLFADLLAAYAADDRPQVGRLLGEVETVLAEGATAEHRRRAAVEAEAEARKTLDLSRRLVDTEARIVMRRQAMVTIEQLQALTARFADLAAGMVATMEAAMTARGIAASEAAEIGRSAIGEFAAELQQLVPEEEVN
jgi:hypothetical protein